MVPAGARAHGLCCLVSLLLKCFSSAGNQSVLKECTCVGRWPHAACHPSARCQDLSHLCIADLTGRPRRSSGGFDDFASDLEEESSASDGEEFELELALASDGDDSAATATGAQRLPCAGPVGPVCCFVKNEDGSSQYYVWETIWSGPDVESAQCDCQCFQVRAFSGPPQSIEHQ